MRNRLLFALAVAAAVASSVFADSKDFTINKTDTIVNFESGDYDYNIYYSGTANTRARLGIANAEPAEGYTVRSLTLKAGDGSTSQTPSEWNLLGCFTLNIPTASGEYTVLKNETAKNIHYQMGELTIGNADSASTATALIDLGGGFLRLQGGGAKPQQRVDSQRKRHFHARRRRCVHIERQCRKAEQNQRCAGRKAQGRLSVAHKLRHRNGWGVHI